MSKKNNDSIDPGAIIFLVIVVIGWAAYFLRPMLEAISKMLGDDHMDDVREQWNEVAASIQKADASMTSKVLAVREVFSMGGK